MSLLYTRIEETTASPAHNSALRRANSSRNTDRLPEVSPDALDFACTRLGFEPDPPQAAILASQHRRLLLNCSRQWGKSTVTAIKALHTALRSPGITILAAGPTLRQSQEFVDKFRHFARKLGLRTPAAPGHKTSAVLPNGARLIGLPSAGGDNIRGFSAPAMLILDEASRIEDSAYFSILPMLATNNGAIWLLSTPKGKSGFFYNAWTHGGADWDRVSVPATDCPRISPEFLETSRRNMGDDWVRQEFLCEFIDVDGTVFARDAIDRAFHPEVKLMGAPDATLLRTSSIVIGVDLGQRHDFTAIAVIEHRPGRPPHFLQPWDIPIDTFDLRYMERVPLGTPYTQVVERIAELAHRPEFANRCSVAIDATGTGVPVVDMLRQKLDCRLIPITITGGFCAHHAIGASTVPKRDLILTLELLLEDATLRIAPALPERARLVEELMAFRAAGYSRKHDDLVLALSLACWVARKPTIGHQPNRLL